MLYFFPDCTLQYHNLLVSEDKTEQKEQTFYWDGNVAAMEEDEMDSYYLQDDLGSPMQLMDEEGEIKETYGFDEFGLNLENHSKSQMQPFGYTGYQMEAVGGLYFAQARRYDAGAGRFAGRDIIKGYMVAPYTLNEYGYCWGNPMVLVDLDGRFPGEWTPGEDTDYVGVYYLNSEHGACSFGHAALLFMKEDGSGTFYSFVASRSEALNIIKGKDVPGYLSKANLEITDVEAFLGNSKPTEIAPGAGKVETDGIDDDFLDGGKNPYSRYIYIPITLQEGKAMSYYAEKLRDENGTGIYNLYARNCGMVAQDILRVGGKSFAEGSEKGKNADEQIALGKLFYPILTFNLREMIMIVVHTLIKDYMDQTMPDAAYHKGWMVTNFFLFIYGWETGKIKKYKGCEVG